MELEKSFDPKYIENRWYASWESAGYFKPAATAGQSAYCIMLPPPNVTGTLHMGHAFQHTLMDALTRYHRMLGDNTLWQPGTDHAGIATQIVVERQLDQQKLNRRDMGREAFLERVWQWKEESGSTITRQMRRLGTSCDWTRERFTMDATLSRAVTEVFVRLYREGLIYRGKRLVNWDPVLQTAVSDLEVVSTEENGSLWHIRYPLELPDGSLEDPDEALIVATTRPETMLGDVAVAVHPDDSRYRHLIGRHVRLPLCERTIPIIADTYVDLEFGTGCVKITPAHDFNDYQVGQRHHLVPINIFTLDAKINEHAPASYQGLDRFEARKQILADLEKHNLLAATKPHNFAIFPSTTLVEIGNLEADDLALFLDPPPRCAVAAAGVGGVLEKESLADTLLELPVREEEVVDAVDLPGARGARGGRDAAAQARRTGLRAEQRREHRVLAHAARAGENDQAAARRRGKFRPFESAC